MRCWLQVKTILDETLTGQLYFTDENILILESKPEEYIGQAIPPHVSLKSDFTIVNVSCIQEITRISPNVPFEPLLLQETDQRILQAPLPPPQNMKGPQAMTMAFDRLLEREQKALSKAYQEMSSIGINVSAEAQTLFDTLSKTLPCKWKGEKIIVLDEITISPPYKASNCSANNSSNAAASLERVKKVVSNKKPFLGF